MMFAFMIAKQNAGKAISSSSENSIATLWPEMGLWGSLIGLSQTDPW